MATIESKLRRLIDKSEIKEQIYSWSRGVARRDWDLVRSVFHPDAHDDHGTLNGSIAQYIEWQKRHHAGVDQSVHFLGNMLIDFADDDTALAETNVIAFHHYRADCPESRADIVGLEAAMGMGEMTSLIVGRYLDKMARRDGVWRIAHRQAVFETARTEAAGRNLLPHWVAAQRDETDLLFRIRSEMGLGSLVSSREV